MSLATNLQTIQARIETACRKAGRNPLNVTLIAVSKMVTKERVLEAESLGVQNFGENYLQEALDKMSALPKKLTWHFIGRLQSNKLKMIVEHFDFVHSIDSLEKARAVDARANSLGKKLKVFLQINIANESTKTGFDSQVLLDCADSICQLENLQVFGLMSFPPEDPTKLRFYFAQTRQLAHEVSVKLGVEWNKLSMGTSHDFEDAILEGATHIRVGTSLFGERISNSQLSSET